MKVSLILTCAGVGARAGFGKNKLLVEIEGKTVLEKTLWTFIDSQLIDEFIVTANEEDFELIKSLLPEYCKLVLGGQTRTQSVKNALSAVSGQIVLIHDGARPFVNKEMIADCINIAKRHGGAVPVIPCRDTILRANGETVADYLGKDHLYAVQTPQGFNTKLLIDAYARASDQTFNDDGQVYKQFIGELATFHGDDKNVKLTYHQDFDYFNPIRVGTGFDCHRLVEGRKLILGGITIPHDKGLLGHSDADVLIHAIMDAILSAASLRDIGYWFSDKDPAYKDADSMVLFKKVIEMIAKKGYAINNISAVIMAEKPKLLNHIPQITQNIANVANLPVDAVGITATTLEGLGFVGREEGICTHASVTLCKA